MKNYYATFIFLITIIPLYSQKAPIKFGKVDRSDLEMTYYDKDSTVAAVILCDYGYFNSNDFSFTRLLRIKILKKEGYSWANRSFNTYSKASIRGRTYNLENGEIEEEKLKNSSIYRERVTGSHYIMKVTMPNVKVGSVIDFEYSYVGFPNEWRFQETIPVCWSELILEPSIYIEFQKNFFGFEPLDVQTSSRWVAKDMPAFKEEPYMNSMENYLTKFEFDIMQISYQGYFRDFTTSWDAVSEFLLNHAYFGDVLIGSDYLKSTIKDIKSESDLKQDQLEAAFNAVKRVKWNEQQRIFAFSNNLSFVWKDEIGNSAEIN
nr:DUF3857 domain-containing protein [Bacteroidota bacterium]